MSPVIVPIALAHVASFREALDRVAKEKRYLAMIEAPPLAQVESFVRGNVEKGIAQFVGLVDERVVGWADVVPAWAHAVAHRGGLGMGVLPEYRGQGLGRRLLEACIERSWANGLTRIDLEVRTDNERAVRLYRALGFRDEGLMPRGIRIDGRYFETLRMGLLRPERAGDAGSAAESAAASAEPLTPPPAAAG
jgi:ribosomal protein S18 acetylase RimI-like enzyme